MDALHTLLKGVIDYAGMFPPAKLSLEEAWGNYRSYLQSEDAWMLGSFVMPIDELSALESMLDDLPTVGPIALSVIGRSGQTPAAWKKQLKQDFAEIMAFLKRKQGIALVQNYEFRLPVVESWEIPPHETSLTKYILDGLPKPTEFTGMVSFAMKQASEFSESPTQIFFEPPRQQMEMSAWYGALAEVGAVLSGKSVDNFGLKLRTGGTEAAAIPSTREVALFMQVCHEFELRWKATAGLHQPLRHHDPELGTDLHGFINLLMSAVLMRSSCVAHSPVLILSDTDPEHFEFDGELCHWGLTAERVCADKRKVRQARTHGFASFGSCDFDEPRDHLRRLGWLTEVSSPQR